ncbi:hypothetical protein GCM10027447_23500 [Glycomyces halotolerans]
MLLRLGGLLHRFRRLRTAALVYAASAALCPANPQPSYRLAVVRQSTGSLTAARDAYTAALEAGIGDRVSCLRRRAKVNRRLKDFEAARADYELLIELDPGDQQSWKGFASSLERLSRLEHLPDIVRALDRASETGEEADAETLHRAKLKADLGDWAGSLQLYRALIARHPDDSKLKFDAGSIAERLYRVPFRLTDGGITPAGSSERRAALAEGVDLFEGAATDPDRVWAPYRMGLLHEHAGNPEAAAQAYQDAINRAEAADKSWSELQMAIWSFRRDRTLHGGDADAADDRLAFELHEGEPLADPAKAVGYCSVALSNFGLVVTGFVLPGAAKSVTVSFDGEPVSTVKVDTAHWRPEYKLAIKFDVLKRLGRSTTLTFSADGRPLVTSEMSDHVRLENPRGDGSFLALRSAGHTVNKKGHWSPRPDAADWKPGAAVDAYVRLRDFFERRFDRKLFVLYGTLLGCHRDGTLIPGDDDFDAAYVARGDTPEEAKRDSMEIMRVCLEAGFDVGLGFEGRPFNIRVDGYSIDVNPVWFYRGKAWAFNSHKLAPEHFEPPVLGTLEGREVYVPADTEAFLEENYGPDWRTPNSRFKYYRSKRTVNTIRRTQLVLSEVRAIRELAEQARKASPNAGRFYGWVDQ